MLSRFCLGVVHGLGDHSFAWLDVDPRATFVRPGVFQIVRAAVCFEILLQIKCCALGVGC